MNGSSGSAGPPSSSQLDSDSIALRRRVREFSILSISLILILIFSYFNLYGLPLGTTSIDGVIQNADGLYGSEVGVQGKIFHSSENEFFLVDGDGANRLEAIWLGGANLPSNGTGVVASGMIVRGPDGPVLMCEQLSAANGLTAPPDNPWALPALRSLVPALVWFQLMVFAIAILSWLHMRRPTIAGRNRMLALSEISSVAGAGLVIPAIALAVLEPAFGSMLGTFTLAITAALALMLISLIARLDSRRRFEYLADAVPMLAAIIALIGIILLLLQAPTAPEDLLGFALTVYLPESAPVLIAGAAGLLLLGIYISGQRFEALTIRDLFAQRGSGAK